MKKTFSLILILFFSISIISAQNNDAEIDALNKKIEKNNTNIENPKKSEKVATWSKRGKLFLDAYSINFKYLAPGIFANLIPTLGLSESSPQPYYGKCEKIYVEGDFTVWEYPKVKIYITDQGLVDHWEEKEVFVPDALTKSYDAYKKAIKLDVDKKFISKNITIQDLSMLRENLKNKAVKEFYDGDAVSAINDLEKSIDLYQYTKEPDASTPDTVLGTFAYYAGIFAYNAKKSVTDTNLTEKEIQANIKFNKPYIEKSKKYFQMSIDNEYEIGTSYQYVSQIMFEDNDSLNAVTFLENGATKYPSESKIIYSLIDYYTPRGEYKKAFQYLDKAIQMTPDVAVLYIVKGNAYEKIFNKLQINYFGLLSQADSLDKLSFKNRSNATLSKEYTDKKNNILNNEVPTVKEKMEEYAKNTTSAFKLAVTKDETNSDYFYIIGDFYYRRAITNISNASNLRKLKTIVADLEKSADGYLQIAKTNAEKSHELKPQDIYTLDLLAKIYYRLKMYDESTEMKNKIKEIQNAG